MMKWYGAPLPAPNPRRVRIYLAERDITNIQEQHVNMLKGEHKSKQIMERNSLGQLPVLEIGDGEYLSESVSICRYLEEAVSLKENDSSLFGNTPLEKARVDMWIRRVEFQILIPVANYWRNSHPLTASVVPIRFPEFGESNILIAQKGMGWLNKELGEKNHQYLAGDFFSMADIVLLSIIDFAEFIGIDIPEMCTNLRSWHERVKQRPSCRL